MSSVCPHVAIKYHLPFVSMPLIEATVFNDISYMHGMSVIGRVNIVHTQQLSTLRALSTVYVDIGIIVEIKAVFYKYTASSHTHTRTHAHALLRSCMDAYTHAYISILDTFTIFT